VGTEQQSSSKSKFTPKFRVATRGFVAFPAFFVDELMPMGKHIPPSFWKFLLVLWRDVNHHKDNTSKKSMRHFHIRSEDASKWAAALFVSGLFFMKYGWKHAEAEKGFPTEFKYLDADFEHWEWFITALEEQIVSDKKHGYKDSGRGFRAELLFRKIRIRWERTGDPLEDWEKNILNKWEQQGYLKHRSEGRLRCFSTRRLCSDKSGVLRLQEKIQGSYPSQGEPQYDDYGNQIRMFRQPVWAEDIVVVDMDKKGNRTGDGTASVPSSEQ
jgi:hypothetical protein